MDARERTRGPARAPARAPAPRASPGQQARASPGQQARASPGQQARASPGQQARASPGQQARASPGQQARASPGQQASALFTHMLTHSDGTQWKINTLSKALKGQVTNVLDIAKQFPQTFDLTKAKGSLDLICPLDACTDHWSTNGCLSSGYCQGLHVCKFFVMGSCPSSNCKFGHQFNSDHNTLLLVECNLDRLNEEQLRKLLKNARAFNEEGLPPVCTFHNSPRGCKKGRDGEGCPFMHVCERFVKTDTCTFADDACRYSHDLMKPQTRQILIKYGYDISYENMSSVLRRLRKIYSPNAPANQDRPSGGRPRPGAEFVLPRPPPSQQGGRERHHSAGVEGLRERSTSAGSPQAAGGKDNHPRGKGKRGKYNRQRSDSRDHSAGMARDPTASARPKPPPGPIPSPARSKSVSADEICTFHLRDKCKFETKCQFVHTDLPYQWQYKEKGLWLPFTPEANATLEKAFCQPQSEGATVAVTGGVSSMKVEFGTMAYSGCGRGEVRRVSTESWGKAFKNRPFITKWLWYFLDERNKWQEYNDSCEIEEEYLKGSSEFEFQVRHHQYVLNFKEMYQKNTKFETEREVRRRPQLYVKSEPAKCEGGQKERAESESVSLPESWCSGIASAVDFELKLVQLPTSSPEYIEVARRFAETMSDPIKCITRIQNFDLWEEYAGMKKRMLKKKSGASTLASKTSMTDLCKELNEKLLFHGTSQKYIEPIYTHRGFDFRNAGTSVGTLYGRGNYFARDASYSKCYTDCRQLFVVKVLVGEVAKGKSDLTKPPPLDASQPYGRLYDCCVDSLVDPSIFVTFEFGQSYPAYLIEY